VLSPVATNNLTNSIISLTTSPTIPQATLNTLLSNPTLNNTLDPSLSLQRIGTTTTFMLSSSLKQQITSFITPVDTNRWEPSFTLFDKGISHSIPSPLIIYGKFLQLNIKGNLY
jgi:hypothetical protein